MRERRVGQDGCAEFRERVETINSILTVNIDNHRGRLPGWQPDQGFGPATPPIPDLIEIDARVAKPVSR
jgi:hypothetical protein